MEVAILGGGIGGLSAAIALKQEGFDVTVYERFSQPTDIGAGIVCWPNASFVLDQLGVLNKVAQVSGSLNKMNRLSSDGEPLGSLDIHDLNRLMEYPSYSIIRSDLMSILIQRLFELNIEIHYQHEVIDLSDTNLGTRVLFENGKRRMLVLAKQQSETYKRHRPETTLLYQLVERYYPDFTVNLADQGKYLPKYVEREFGEFLRCGRLEHGFLRVVCGDCKHEKLVAFSCKRRGFYSGLPALRPSGQPSVVQNRSRRFCALAAGPEEWQKVQRCL